MQTIVVGIDGSENGIRALRWALDHASSVGARVLAVHAWGVPAFAFGGPGYVSAIDPSEYERAANATLDEALAGLASDLPAGVELERRAVEGGAAGELIDVEREVGAALLVVGSRGHGGFAGLLLGSVSATLAHHTPCPLVIVPPVAHD